ncbi:uncharacterized protein EDB91DRAFT_1345031 [Suillus paluster]|uniref:uncharacterized protein n=1 Tax=Suillus paluster TaxID=48578 RepID=UPI001B883262|nr:uncharacterized protein EDB91DRAFT_1345031 [Suillus paluster]KAG1747811.1 hypothetical protein EDB91DRAFT_1345031 [Suillus paluster]
MQTANSETDFSTVSAIIGALKNILTRSQVIIPDLETPYSKFPNTDHSATEHKDQSIIVIISKRQRQLDAVSLEISGLETVICRIQNLHQQLIKKKDKIAQSINLHKGLVSSLWRLPTEVLCQIFDLCVPETRFLLPPSRLNAPMLLTEICRRWREVAVSMPRLWCRLSATVDDRDWQRAAFCYESWLKRPQGLPLSLALKCSNDHSAKLRSLLQPHIDKISSLSIYFVYGADKPELMLTDLQALEKLTIGMHDYHIMPAITHSISQLPITMRSLKVTGPLFDLQRLSSFNTIWAHLTNVEIAIREPHAVLHLLQLSPNLSSLTIRAAFNQTQTLEPFTHAEIQSLRVAYDSGLTRPLSHLFDALSLPNLRVLEARCRARWTYKHEELKAFLVRSKCPLKNLIFGGRVMMTDEERAEYVSLIPSLEVVVDPSDKYFA